MIITYYKIVVLIIVIILVLLLVLVLVAVGFATSYYILYPVTTMHQMTPNCFLSCSNNVQSSLDISSLKKSLIALIELRVTRG